MAGGGRPRWSVFWSGPPFPAQWGLSEDILAITPGWRSSRWPPPSHQRSRGRGAGRFVQGTAVALALLACGVGLPARLLVVWLEWDLRDAGRVEKFVTSHLRPTDQVFSIYEAYYPAKASAKGVVLPAYIGEPFAPDAPPGAITHERTGTNQRPDPQARLRRKQPRVFWRGMAAGRAATRLIRPAAYRCSNV